MTRYAEYLTQRARLDPTAFAALAGRDETTGRGIELAGFHAALHALWGQHARSVAIAPPECGKTSQLQLRLAWELGRDPSLRVHWVSNAVSAAEKNSLAVGRIIESEDFRKVFPSVRIERRWAGGFSLAGRPSAAKDATVAPVGFGNASALGSRVSLVIGDDVIGLDDVLTANSRERAWHSWSMTHLSRLAPGGRVIVVGTSWHSDDVLHRAGALPGWAFRRFPIQAPDGQPLWPERWPLARIAERRRELGPHRARTLLDCEPIDGASLVFPAEHVAEALRRGEGAVSENYAPLGGRLVLGVDVAFSTAVTSDESALVLVRVLDDDTREVVQVWAGRWDFDGLCSRIVDVAQRHAATCYIESNGGGTFVHEQVAKRVPSVALATTASSKAARTEWLSAELATRRWSIRHIGGQLPEESRRLCEDLLGYSPEAHCGDRLAALFVAVEGIRQHQPRPKARWHNLNIQNR